MTSEEEQKKVLEIKKYITDHFQLAQISNEELEEKVEQIVNEYMSDAYCSSRKFRLRDRFTAPSAGLVCSTVLSMMTRLQR